MSAARIPLPGEPSAARLAMLSMRNAIGKEQLDLIH
jgi:hypothetical protein